MIKWILFGIILVSPLIILVEIYIIILLLEALEILIDEIVNIIYTIKNKFGGK